MGCAATPPPAADSTDVITVGTGITPTVAFNVMAGG